MLLPRLRLRFAACLLAVVSVALLSLLATRTDIQAASPGGRDAARGGLLLNIPYPQAAAGGGRLTIELVDPEEHVLGRSERHVDVGPAGGAWRQSLVTDKPLAFEDAVWERVRWRFAYDDGGRPVLTGVEAVSDILLRPVVRVLGQTEYIAGSQAALRVVVTDGTESGLVESGTLRLLLANPENAAAAPRELFRGKLDRRGSVEAQFRLPAGVTGACTLHFIADTPVGSSEYTETIHLEDKAQILLTTEKPIYQPGQLIHVRALALDRAEHHAVAGRGLTFEIEDSRGNKVFKKTGSTDRFGIASAEFQLADEVNLGTYHVRALMGSQSRGEPGDAQSPTNTAEIALNVDRYVLPKFKVAVEFDKKDGKTAREKRDFRPGDHVTGTVRANYFFGKPVDHAAIEIKASAMDVELVTAASATGKTDGDGVYHFDLKLPDYFAGRPTSAGAARVLVEASVKDSAAHTETRGEPITVSQSALLITAVPEGGQLLPGLDNRVYVLTSYPDGTPAMTTLTAQVQGMPVLNAGTDAGGVAVIHLRPAQGTTEIAIAANDHAGSAASARVPLEARGGTEQILLRTSRAVVKAGDKLQLQVLSTRARGAAYIDVVRNGQTILTRDVELENGQAELNLNVTADMAGTLDVDAYLFGRDAEPVADHRLLFVQPADELRITTAADAAMYKPGGEATIRFHVANSHGEGVSAALGVQIVDEAVFALAEKQPGFAKTFFYLEQEVMKPRFEIHSLSYDQVIAPLPLPRGGETPEPDQDAQALFSATEVARPHVLRTEFGRVLPRVHYDDFAQRYQTAFANEVKEIDARLASSLGHVLRGGAFIRAFDQVRLADGSVPRDAWGGRLQISTRYAYGKAQYFEVRSAGPDHQFNTADDLVLMVHEAPAPAPVKGPGPAGDGSNGSDLTMEHDRGPQNGLAETAGVVQDPTGATIPQAEVSLRRLSDGRVRTTHSDPAGNFTLSGLAPGEYELSVAAPGFMLSRRQFIVQARDRAVINATLSVGSAATTVEVSAESVAIETDAVAPMMFEQRMMAPMGRAQGMGAAAAMINDGMNARMAGVDRARAATMPAPKAAPGAVLGAVAGGGAAPAAAPHVRSYFPEALYINPEIITDGHGDASITIPVADSITTWRMALMASTERGALGSGTSSLKVFQDFFVDLDLPVRLTQGDQVTIPVGIYNYSGKPGQVHLKLEQDKWFTLANDQPEKTVESQSGQVGGSGFSLRADRIGTFKLTLTAHLDGAQGQPGRDDIIVREIEVVPNGKEQNLAFNGRLDHTAEHTLTFPAGVVPDATTLFVRLYPGPLSQLVEGMDAILRMPYGCFEQTSSATYPNVLALDYMKQTGKLTPEVHAKAEGFIVNGYQRLLTFEVPGGGFSWFGQTPANKILTAYGLMEFHDMAQVSEVDPRLIERTAQWLASQQQADGSWKPDSSFINEGATNRYNSDTLRITAYIGWSLANVGYKGEALERAKQYVEQHAAQTTGKPDVYTLAVIANFAADYGKDRDFTQHAMQALVDARTEKDGQVFWDAQETGFYTTGQSAATETTGLATQALLKWGQAGEIARKSLAYLAAKKQADGTWGTTQATIMALRSLLLASKIGTADTRGTVSVTVDGKRIQTLTLTPENNDLLHQFVVHDVDPTRPTHVGLSFEGSGGLAYQVVGRYFTPWQAQREEEALAIDVSYDRTRLAQNDIATATAHIHNNLAKSANLVMVDLGIPPGFELQNEDLQTMVEQTRNAHGGKLEKFSQTATQAILYFDALAPHQTVTVKYRLRAKYPVRARTFASRVYEYYTPDVNATALPVELEVQRK